MAKTIFFYIAAWFQSCAGDYACAMGDGWAGQSLLQLRADSKGVGLRFLRIQKTGSTTLHHTLDHFCSPKQLCKSKFHLDWTQAHHGWTGPVLTLLRDPVERTLSEFYFLRTGKGQGTAHQTQWNYDNNNWLSSVAHARTEDALDEFLYGDPRSPSINRQALYLLGFNEAQGAGSLYDWNNDRSSLLQRAKANLDALPVFGITDCFETSMRVIARTFGWPEEEVVAYANSQHHRSQDKTENIAWMHTSSSPFALDVGALEEVSGATHSWRDLSSPALIEAIEETNAVDMELYRYAKTRFQERFGESCISP